MSDGTLGGESERDGVRRRRFLAGTGAIVGSMAAAGCLDVFGNEDTSRPGLIGSGRTGRDAPDGTPMAEMPDLGGTLTVYSGRGEPLVGTLLGAIDDHYDDLDLEVLYGGSTDHANRILTEGSAGNADVFYSVDAGSLGILADEGRTVALPPAISELVPSEFQDPDGNWIGTSGRARTVPYNTDQFSDDDVPDDIGAFPETDAFDGKMGWAPSYGSFQAFVTALRLLEGEAYAKTWLRGMLDNGVREYANEWLVAQAIADGEIGLGFTNHYYVQRVIDGRDDPPIATAFTEGDAGAIFNVAGAAVVDTTDDEGLAANFVRHLLSAEAQDYFARETFEYPLVPEVEPIGRLPSIDELNPPADLDLTRLSDLEPTLELMRDVGINV